MLVAGHETTAVALFWSCYLLARSPHWQERVAMEFHPAAISDRMERQQLWRTSRSPAR